MRVVSMVFAILIGVGGLAYIIAGVRNENIASIAAGWAMLAYSRQELIRDDIHELKDEIQNLKNKK